MLVRYKNSASVKVRKKSAALKDSESGVASIEFALIFPIFLAIFYGVVEISYYNMVSRRAQMSVDFASEYMSRDDDNYFTFDERHVVEDIWMIVNTSSFNNTGGAYAWHSRGNYSRALSAIEFDKTPAGCSGSACTFTPRVKWAFNASNSISSPKRRNCTQTIVPNNVKLDEHTLPEGMTGRSAIVVSDFVYKYNPLIKNGFIQEQEKHIIAIRKTRGDVALEHPQNNWAVVHC